MVVDVQLSGQVWSCHVPAEVEREKGREVERSREREREREREGVCVLSENVCVSGCERV